MLICCSRCWDKRKKSSTGTPVVTTDTPRNSEEMKAAAGKVESDQNLY